MIAGDSAARRRAELAGRNVRDLANDLRLRWNAVARRIGAAVTTDEDALDSIIAADKRGARADLAEAIVFLEQLGPGAVRQVGESDGDPRAGEKLWDWIARTVGSGGEADTSPPRRTRAAST